MRNLFAFIAKHNFIFFFLFLQSLCVWLMVQNNHYQGSRILNSANRLSAVVYQTASAMREYFSLKQENDRLSRENALLRNFMRMNFMAIPGKEFHRNDTLYKE